MRHTQVFVFLKEKEYVQGFFLSACVSENKFKWVSLTQDVLDVKALGMYGLCGPWGMGEKLKNLLKDLGFIW